MVGLLRNNVNVKVSLKYRKILETKRSMKVETIWWSEICMKEMASDVIDFLLMLDVLLSYLL